MRAAVRRFAVWYEGLSESRRTWYGILLIAVLFTMFLYCLGFTSVLIRPVLLERWPPPTMMLYAPTVEIVQGTPAPMLPTVTMPAGARLPDQHVGAHADPDALSHLAAGEPDPSRGDPAYPNAGNAHPDADPDCFHPNAHNYRHALAHGLGAYINAYHAGGDRYTDTHHAGDDRHTYTHLHFYSNVYAHHRGADGDARRDGDGNPDGH